MLLKLLPCIAREVFFCSNFERIPEPDMLMEDRRNTSAYDLEGKDGVLLGVYYYHIMQMCGVINDGDIVVDLGCGSCNLLCILAELNPSCEFIGIDLSDDMLELARKNIKEKNIRNIKLLKQDITDIKQITNNSIDVVISSMAIHHLPTKELLTSLFKEIERILKSDKRLYLYDFGKIKRTETIDFFLGTVNNVFVKEDYKNSLKAAFTVEDFKYLTSKYLGENIQLFSTLCVPVIVVIKNTSHALKIEQKKQLNEMVKRLNSQQKNDFKMVKLFLLMNGMRSLL